MNSHSSNSVGKPSNLWILDIGATYHISHDTHALIHCKHIILVHVNLPDGYALTTFMSGSVNIFSNLIIHNVLYIPSFHVNLISISKLTSTNKCSILFDADIYKIVQNHSHVMIGTTKLQRRLYVMDITSQPSNCNSATFDSCTLWHLRLGHVSDTGMKSICQRFPFVSCKPNNVPCHSCHFSKQKKSLFPNSVSKSASPFDILHADVWGPYSTISMSGHKYFSYSS